MKYTLYNITCACALAAPLLTACGDFLEPEEQSSYVPRDATSMNELLLGEAYPLYSGSYINVWMSLLDDDVQAAPYQKPHATYDETAYLAAYSWQPQMFTLYDEAGLSTSAVSTYRHLYSYIKGCNAVLDYMDDATGDALYKEYVEAQARTLRAFYYLQLVCTYATPYNVDPEALGIPLKLTSQVEEETLHRSTVAQCYDAIVADLTRAEELFSAQTDAQYRWAANYRASLPMAQLLLARTYLYMEHWEQAAAEALRLMENSDFHLYNLNGIISVLDYSVPGNVSSAFPLMTNMIRYANPEVIWLWGSVSDVVSWAYSNVTDTDGTLKHAYFMASDNLMQSYEDADLRRHRYIARSWYQLPDAEPRTSSDEDAFYDTHMPMAIGKVGMGQTATSYYTAATGSGYFGRALRLSEAYLTYIEAEAMLWQQGRSECGDLAVSALNRFRLARISQEDYVALSFADAAQLVTFVRQERRREFCFEGLRWFDLRRWGMPRLEHVWYPDADTRQVYVLEEGDPTYVLPLPEDALGANVNLQQNPLGTSPRVAHNL